MIRSISCITTFLLIFCCSCKSGNTSDRSSTEIKKDSVKAFTLPEIPAMYTNPEQRADFLVKHYWDNLDLADTNYVHHPEITEQAWADYINILNHVPLKTAQQSLQSTMANAGKEKATFAYFTGLADKYLYDPNSPYRNEEFYIPVLESMIASSRLEEIEKTRPKYRLNLALKNRVGTKAIDFTYTLKSGVQNTLHKIPAEYTLLYINNPGCHACEEIIESLKSSLTVHYFISRKKMTILALYPDEDLDEWEKHRSDFPAEWINGYDKGTVIKLNELYDLKAIPTLYLLDKDKNVLLKDATFSAIEEYLRLRMQ